MRSLRRPQSVCLALIICHVDYLALKKKRKFYFKTPGSNGQEVPRAGEGPWAPELTQGTTTIDSLPPAQIVSCHFPPPPSLGAAGVGGGLRAAQGPSGEAGGGEGPRCGAGPPLVAAGRREQAAAGALVGAA